MGRTQARLSDREVAMQLYLIRKANAWINVFSATAADQAARFAAEPHALRQRSAATW